MPLWKRWLTRLCIRQHPNDSSPVCRPSCALIQPSRARKSASSKILYDHSSPLSSPVSSLYTHSSSPAQNQPHDCSQCCHLRSTNWMSEIKVTTIWKADKLSTISLSFVTFLQKPGRETQVLTQKQLPHPERYLHHGQWNRWFRQKNQKLSHLLAQHSHSHLKQASFLSECNHVLRLFVQKCSCTPCRLEIIHTCFHLEH